MRPVPKNIPADLPQRLEEFGYEALYEALTEDARGLVNLVKEKLLRPSDGEVRVYTARTVTELDRLNTCDVVILDNGRELTLFWHDGCLRLR